MAIRVVVVDTPADADRSIQDWSGMNFRLLDAGAMPTGFQYFESTDITAPIKQYATKYVMVFTDAPDPTR